MRRLAILLNVVWGIPVIPESIKNNAKSELEKWKWNGNLGGCWGMAMRRFGELSLKCGSIDDQIKNLLALSLTSCHFQYNPNEFPSQSDKAVLDESGCDVNRAFVLLRDGAPSDGQASGSGGPGSGGQDTGGQDSGVQGSGGEGSYDAGSGAEPAIDQIIKNCKQHMTGSALSSFVSIYNHLDNVCFYVNSELWQQKTEQTVERVVTQLAALDRRHEELLHQADRLKLNLEAGNDNLQIAFGNMQEQVNKESQKILSLFDETFTLVNRLFVFQKNILTRLASFETLLVYSMSILLAYYTTAADSTRRARASIYFICSCMAVGEMVLRRYPLPTQVILSYIPIETVDITSPDFLIRPWRYTCATIAAYVWLKAFLTYKDPTSLLVAKMDALASRVEKTLAIHGVTQDRHRQEVMGAGKKEEQTDDTSDSDYNTDEEEQLIKPRRRNPPRSGRPTLYRPPRVGSLEDVGKLGLNAMLLFESANDFTQLFDKDSSDESCCTSSSELLLPSHLIKQEETKSESSSDESLELLS